MTLVKRHNGNEFLPLFDQLFDRFFYDSPAAATHYTRNIPAVNIKETATDFLIELAAPGLAKEQFQIQVEENLLTVSGKKEVDKEEVGIYKRKEFNYAAFKRSFELPETADKEQISARYDLGILTVQIAKATVKQPKVKAIEIVG